MSGITLRGLPFSIKLPSVTLLILPAAAAGAGVVAAYFGVAADDGSSVGAGCAAHAGRRGFAGSAAAG